MSRTIARSAGGYEVELFDTGSPMMSAFRRLPGDLHAGDPYLIPPDDPPDAPETACFLVFRGGVALGRACGMVNPAIEYHGGRTALAGWYECADDPLASAILLEGVAAHYRALGYDYLLGPLNGSTWHRYRIADPSAEPPFFLDVHNPPWYRDQWIGAGFESVSRYYSAKGPCHAGGEENTARLVERYRDRGITIRPFAPDRFDEELRKLHEVSLAGFTGSPFYTPIGFDEFRGIYTGVRPLVDPEFVLIAERGDRPLGFLFALRNIHQRSGMSLVIKTVVVVPEPSARGLGTLLARMVHARAAELGYDEVIHALMHVSNSSTKILAGESVPFRSYTLFGREL